MDPAEEVDDAPASRAVADRPRSYFREPRPGLTHAEAAALVARRHGTEVAGDDPLCPAVTRGSRACLWFADGVHRCCVPPPRGGAHGTGVQPHGCLCPVEWTR